MSSAGARPDVLDNDAMQGVAHPGLLGLVHAYLETLDISEEERCKISRYLDLIKRRSTGANYFLGLNTGTKMAPMQALSRRLQLGSETSSALIRSTSMIRWSARRSTTTLWSPLMKCKPSAPFFSEHLAENFAGTASGESGAHQNSCPRITPVVSTIKVRLGTRAA